MMISLTFPPRDRRIGDLLGLRAHVIATGMPAMPTAWTAPGGAYSRQHCAAATRGYREGPRGKRRPVGPASGTCESGADEDDSMPGFAANFRGARDGGRVAVHVASARERDGLGVEVFPLFA